MTERHAERRLVKHRLVGSCGSVAGSRPRFSPAVSFELGGRGGFIAAVRRLPQLDLQLATPPNSEGRQQSVSVIGSSAKLTSEDKEPETFRKTESCSPCVLLELVDYVSSV
ncbi:hypothetical protein T4D_17179 [Trichinella pseudospiralis]|uniref:Uncharacterized protein n=1 Tax=Trichinella pseudospiralis TaxID=6337 RepID=A0A0V1FBR2_TRIPS|nr:hypothetical protein T4D_17179 [Trichinella pseudospiralis]